jgi:hypothetical protein
MTPDDDDYQLRACARFVRFAGETFSFPPYMKERREEKERKERKRERERVTFHHIHTYNDLYRH